MAVLARALQQRGHEVILCGTPGSGPTAQEMGIPYQPSGLDMQQIFRSNKDLHVSFTKMIRRVWRLRQEEVESQFRAVEEAAVGADLIVSAGAQFSGGSVASRTGAAHVTVFYVPTALPSPSHAPVMVPWSRTPPWCNRLLWRCNAWFMKAMVGSALNHERARLGLPPVRTFHDAYAPQHRLLAADPELCSLPDDLRDSCTQIAAITPTGEDAVPPDVESFLRAGPAPLYVGFGSMMDRDTKRTTRILLDAILAAGVRAIIARGWAELGQGELPPSCLSVGALPHSALFPRMAAVVHHGGAGTTAAALRAGVPQIIVPHIADQFYFGHRVKTLGLGPAPIPRSKLTVRRLAAAVQFAMTDAPMRQRAREMAEQLSVRHGPEETAAFLERLCGQRPRAADRDR
jgi:vancomycin aglycone glucosyltransferase